MSLIIKPSLVTKHDIKIKLNLSLVEEIKAYCNWAGFEGNLDHFFSEAAAMILQKDKGWLCAKNVK